MLFKGINKVGNGRVITKDEALFECPHCKSIFAKNLAKDKMKRWGKDKQIFYTTKHCPNCDGRILMKDGSRDVLQRKIDRLRQYANQCRITGDLEEYREALEEIANLEEEFKNLMKNLSIKDAAAVALKGLGEVRKQMKDRKTKDDVLISHYKGYMITTNGNKFQATNTVRQIDAFSKEELYRKVDDIEEKRAKMREINRRNADSKTKDGERNFKGSYIEWKNMLPNDISGIDSTGNNVSVAYKIVPANIGKNKKVIGEYYHKSGYGTFKDSKKTKDINPPSESERIKNDFEAGRKDHNAGYYDKWYRWNRKDNGRAYDDGFNSVAGKPVQIIEAMHDSKTKDAELIKKLNGFTIYRDGDEYIVIRDKDNKQVFKSDRSMRTAPLADAYDFIYSQTKDSISIGKHNDIPDDQFNAEELAMGIKIEMEHTENEDIAKAIAKDHLNELKDYYTRLKKMEEEAIEAEKVTKDEGNFLVGKRIIVNAGRFTNAPATVIEIGGQVTHGVNGVYAKMDTGEKVWIARPDFEFKDSKTKDASQAYIDGYTAARGAYHKGTNPIKNDPAKAVEWDRGWEDGKADKDELSAKGSGQEYIKYGSHFKDKKMKDGNGEQALDKCRHSLFPVANELATIASSSIYEDRIRKAAKRAERLVDEARHVLFDAV